MSARIPVMRRSAGLLGTTQQRLCAGPGKLGFIRRGNATAVPAGEPLSQSPPPPPPPPLTAQLHPQLHQQQQQQKPQLRHEPLRQLNIGERAYEPAFYSTLAKIMKLRQRYVDERFIFVPHDDMEELLRGLGATDADFAQLQRVSDNLYSDPTLPFRKSRNCRFCIDFDTSSIRRLEFQPFALSAEEDFKRYDSDTVRVFDEVQDELQLNAAFQGLMLFKALVIGGVPTRPRPKMDYGGNKWVCTLFNVRTVTNPQVLGEPALEGVHTDGVDHTMTTYLGSRNMAPGSAVTLLHEYAETTGIAFHETSPTHVYGRVQHRRFLDTLVVVDAEFKHSLSPVHAVDKDKEATRDMLVFFTRKPVTGDHISASIDSLNPHKTLPMEVPMFVPGWK